MKISGTTQPLWFYGFNIEHGFGDIEVEVTNACNARFLGMKRENALSQPTMVIGNSTNIAAYGLGTAWNHVNPSYYSVLGTSTNVLLGILSIQDAGEPPSGSTVYEALTGQPVNTVPWPNQVSLYKRGELNDALMFVGGVTSHPAFGAPVLSGGKLVLTGNGGSADGTYQVLTSTNITLPLSSWTPVLTNTFGADGSFSNAVGMQASSAAQFYRVRTP